MKKLTTSYKVFIVSSLGLLFACVGDKTPFINNDCEPFESDLDIVIQAFSVESPEFRFPHFNPNNSSEFVYAFEDREMHEYKLMKYNIQTGINTELLSNANIPSEPKWSSEGWIAFITKKFGHNQVFTIKQNGDSLTERTLPSSGLYSNPFWDASGSTLYWQDYNSSNSYFFKQGLYSSDLETVLQPSDATPEHNSMPSLSVSNRFLAKIRLNYQLHFVVTPQNSEDFTSILNVQDEFNRAITGLTWSTTNETAYFTVYHDGLYKINVNSGEYTKIMEFCDTKRYEAISCSPDGTQLIGERVDRSLFGNLGEILEIYSIYSINLQTLEETKINID